MATLKAAAALWALSLLGQLLSVWRLTALGFLLAFTAPVAVDAYRHRLEKAWHDGSRAVQVTFLWVGCLEQQTVLEWTLSSA